MPLSSQVLVETRPIAADASALFKRAEKNPVVTAMLSDFGPQWCHDHLHVHYLTEE